ncbi:MAG: hypothetical protein ACOX7H_02900 [Bacillota bacterium]|jgi:hypothetical protein
MARSLKAKDINFYAVYKEKPAKTSAERQRTKILLSLVFVLLGMMSVYGYLQFQIYMTNHQIEPVIAYIESPVGQDLYDKAIIAENQRNHLEQEKKNLILVQEALQSYPVMTEKEFALLDLCQNSYITLEQIKFDKNLAQFSIWAASDRVTDIPAYIERLKKTGMFSYIVYEGYTMDQNNRYNFNLTCTLKVVKSS